MTARDDFTGTLSAWLDEQAGHRMPDYLDETLARTVRIRQRPAWSSLERFLPMQTTLRFAPVPRLAWLLVILGLVVAGAAAALLAVGSRPQLPAPFGPAANGVIAYGTPDGDIYAFDPVRAVSRPLVTGPSNDETPWFSGDGSKFVFARESTSGGLWHLMVANADGSDIRELTGKIFPEWNDWSPDGTKLAVIDGSLPEPALVIYHLDGSASQVLEIGMRPDTVQWRPSGRELVFRGLKDGRYGLYIVGTDGSSPRLIGPTTTVENELFDTYLSPDGRDVVYVKWTSGPTIRVVNVDTGHDREVTFTGSEGGDGWARWSTDGSQFVFTRGRSTGNRLAVGSINGGPAVEFGPVFQDFTDGALPGISPDGRQIIARYGFDGSTRLLDIGGGPDRLLPATPDAGSYQRVRP